MSKSNPGAPEYMGPLRLVSKDAPALRSAATRRGRVRTPHFFLHGIEHKSCARCGSPKPLTEYGPHKGKLDGLQSQCKDCLKKGRT
jgi:hypothetical protein